MDRYARMLLHFLHAITNDGHRVHTLVFGTRLTNITRHLAHRDVDVALARVTASVDDWAGGTRIGACLADFNRRWSRRLLGQNAVVLLISDGLDAEAGEGLAFEVERLAQVVRAADLAQSVAALRGIRGAARGHPRHPAVRRRLPAGAQHRVAARPFGGARRQRGTGGGAGAAGDDCRIPREIGEHREQHRRAS